MQSLVLVASVLAVVASGCATERVLTRGYPLAHTTLDSLNRLLASADVELRLRGDAPIPPAFRVERQYLLRQDMLLGIGGRDTAMLPLEYVAELRGTRRRSTSRLLVGGLGGFVVGSVAGLLVAPAAPLALGVGGIVVGVTVAALTSQQFVIRFNSDPAQTQ